MSLEDMKTNEQGIHSIILERHAKLKTEEEKLKENLD